MRLFLRIAFEPFNSERNEERQTKLLIHALDHGANLVRILLSAGAGHMAEKEGVDTDNATEEDLDRFIELRASLWERVKDAPTPDDLQILP
jgi:hypothetical protein